MICPNCTSSYIILKGKRRGKQRCLCKVCEKYFTTPSTSEIPEAVDNVYDAPKILSFFFDSPITLHIATDIHHGANEHHTEKFDEFITAVKEDDNARCFLNGDNIELIPPNYKIPQRGQSMEPDDQHLTFYKRLLPIRDKILFIRGGNHDYLRSVRMLGFDVCRVLAEMLQVPYVPIPAYTIIGIGDRRWTMASGHGKSGAVNGDLELYKMQKIFHQADIYVLGHNHQLYAKPKDSLKAEEIEPGVYEERLSRRWFVRGGSFLKFAEYARWGFYELVRTGWVSVKLDDNKIRCWTN